MERAELEAYHEDDGVRVVRTERSSGGQCRKSRIAPHEPNVDPSCLCRETQILDQMKVRSRCVEPGTRRGYHMGNVVRFKSFSSIEGFACSLGKKRPCVAHVMIVASARGRGAEVPVRINEVSTGLCTEIFDHTVSLFNTGVRIDPVDELRSPASRLQRAQHDFCRLFLRVGGGGYSGLDGMEECRHGTRE